jgi:tetratricopeptide (TPR) repeat protein
MYFVVALDNGFMPPQVACPIARTNVQKARQLDSAIGHNGLAVIYSACDWNWAAAEAEQKRALELNPNDPDLHLENAIFLRRRGAFDEAVAEAKRAEELDPLSTSVGVSVGWTYYYVGRYAEARRQFRKTLTVDSKSTDAQFGAAKSCEAQGLQQETIQEWLRLIRMLEQTELAGEVERIYKASGYRSAMNFVYEAQLQLLNEDAKTGRYVSPLLFASLYAAQGAKELAFQWLQKAYDERSARMTDLKLDADFKSLHKDPRFIDLVKRIGLP